MTWALLALSTAVAEAGKDLLCKRQLAELDEWQVAAARNLMTTLWLLPPALALGWPVIRPGFWSALAWGTGLNLAATWCYLRALRRGQMSLTLPLLTFSPLFLLVTSPWLIGEFPGTAGVAGVVAIVVGAYVLNLGGAPAGWTGPFRALAAEPGARWMLGVAVIWSFSANVDKIGLRTSAPVFWALAVNALLAVLFMAGARLASGPVLPVLRLRWQPLLLIGLVSAVSIACQILAVERALVPYVIAVKRLSVVFGVALGGACFHESFIAWRLLGAAIMVTGVACILLG